MGRPAADQVRRCAMTMLGNGLSTAKHFEDALSVQEAELSMERRLGAPEGSILITQSNLANTYEELGRPEESNRMLRDVYSGFLRLRGGESVQTLGAALNYADSLSSLERSEEAKTLLRKIMPVAPRVLGDCHELTLKMRWLYAKALYEDADVTLDDLREAMATLEDAGGTARRVLGGAHPTAVGIAVALRNTRAKLHARDTPPSSA